MSDPTALKIAIEVLLVPSEVRLFRARPLPEGVVTLLRVASGDVEAERAAAAALDRSREVVRSAATFFIEQVLFAPHADAYRVLGANVQASADELRRNVGLLMKWVHPDVDARDERSIYVGRVTSAWNDLKSPERRAAYDEAQRVQRERHESRLTASKAASRGRRNRNPLTDRGRGGLRSIRRWDRVALWRRAFAVLLGRRAKSPAG